VAVALALPAIALTVARYVFPGGALASYAMVSFPRLEDPQVDRPPVPELRLARRLGRRRDRAVQDLPQRGHVRIVDVVLESLALRGNGGIRYCGHARSSGTGGLRVPGIFRHRAGH
jgi:hypothetical protein